MDIRQLLIEKRNELVDKNNQYNENLTLLRNLQNEVEVLESTKEERINKV